MKYQLFIFAVILNLNLVAQVTEFDRAFNNSHFLTRPDIQLNVGDSIPNGYFDSQIKLNNSLSGVQYPNMELPVFNYDTLYLYSLKSDITILNFNYYYCDNCIDKLNEFVEFKKRSTQKVTIIAVFQDGIDDVKTLLSKYGNDIFFIADYKKNLEYYMLNNGTPLTYILNKDKNIISVLSFDNQTLKQ